MGLISYSHLFFLLRQLLDEHVGAGAAGDDGAHGVFDGDIDGVDIFFG